MSYLTKTFILLVDWLYVRKQRVVIKGRAFKWRDVLNGALQSSMHDLVLFVGFVNKGDT